MNILLRVCAVLAILIQVVALYSADTPGRSGQRVAHSNKTVSANRKPDRVTYASFRPGNLDIYLFKQPGQTPQRLTADPNLDYDPVVSTDGHWLVFTSERRGNPDLYVLDLKGNGAPHLLIDSDSLEDQATFSPDGKSITFVSTLSRNADIYLLPFQPDRTVPMTAAQNLTRHPGGDFRPVFSPDGRKLAFSSDRDLPVNAIAPIIRLRDADIYVFDLINKSLSRLTDALGWDGSPAWSADGKTIVYYHAQPRTNSTWRETHSQIWVMNADGTNRRAVSPNETTALSPEFVPGGRIVYSRKTQSGLWQIVSINGDGSDERIESNSSKNSYWKPTGGPSGAIIAHGTGPNPVGVPEGTQVPDIGKGPFLAAGAPFRKKLPDREIDLYPIRYFTAMLNPTKDLLLLTHPPGGNDLLVSRLDGSQQRKLLEFDSTQKTFAGLSWSRDGEWIGFTRDNYRKLESEEDIWKMRADGSGLQNLTPNSPGNDRYPSFSRDGKQIVFRSNRGGNFDFYLMNADGTNVRRLTDNAADELFPVFSPTANQIAFISNRDNLGSSVYEIYLLDLRDDGSQGQLRRVTHNDVQEGHVAFSYDGKWLIYTSEQGGISDEEPLVQAILFAPQMYGEIYAYHIQDETTVRLTHNKWEEGVPSWEAPLAR